MTVAHQLLDMIHVDAKLREPLNQLPLGTGKIFVGDISHGLATDGLGQTGEMQCIGHNQRQKMRTKVVLFFKSRLRMRNHWKIDRGLDRDVDYMFVW